MPAAGRARRRSHNRALKQEQNKSRTRAEQEQNKSRTTPCPRGWSRPMRAPPPAPTAAPQGGSPSFPPKHSVQRERETIAPAFFISAARRRAAAPRGAPKSHFKCRHHFFIGADINITTMRIGTLAGPPRSVLPLPRCPPSGRARAGRGGGLPLPLGRGRPLSRRRARKTALGSSSHSVAGFARVPRFAPAASGERSAWAYVAPAVRFLSPARRAFCAWCSRGVRVVFA